MRIVYDVGIDDLVAFHLDLVAMAARRWGCRVAFLVIVAIGGASGWMAPHDPPPQWVNVILGAGIGAVAFLGVRGLQRSLVAARVRRQHRDASQGVLGRHELTIRDGWLHEATDVNRFSADAATIGPIVTTRDHVYIFLSPGLAHVVPRNSIVEGNVDEFMGELKAAAA